MVARASRPTNPPELDTLSLLAGISRFRTIRAQSRRGTSFVGHSRQIASNATIVIDSGFSTRTIRDQRAEELSAAAVGTIGRWSSVLATSAPCRLTKWPLPISARSSLRRSGAQPKTRLNLLTVRFAYGTDEARMTLPIV